jgi:hypothetical protein
MLCKALFTHNIFAHNIAIKRYCEDNFEPQVSFGQGKLLAQGTLHSFLSLPWLGMETYGSKIFLLQYHLSFYRNILCQNVSCE